MGKDSAYFKELGYEVTSTDLNIEHLKELAEKKFEVQTVDLRNPLPFKDSNIYTVSDKSGLLHAIEKVDKDNVYKVNHLKILCKKLNISPTDTMCIGDGDNDAHLFELSGRGVTFESSLVKDRAKYTIKSLHDILRLVK